MTVCQVAEARHRRQLEQEAVQRDNAQQRRELAEDERKIAAEKVSMGESGGFSGALPFPVYRSNLSTSGRKMLMMITLTGDR